MFRMLWTCIAIAAVALVSLWTGSGTQLSIPGAQRTGTVSAAAVQQDVSRPLREITPIKPGDSGERDSGQRDGGEHDGGDAPAQDADARDASSGLAPDTGDGGEGKQENDNPPVPVPGHVNQPDTAVQRAFHPPTSTSPNGFGAAMPLPSTSWEGISAVTGQCGCIPPDPNGDVGLHNYVQTVNEAFQVWDKTGRSLYGPAKIATIWSGFGGPCELHNDGDPVMLYDGLADRWLVSQFTAEPPYNECVAVSTTGDPTGSYYRYAFQLSTTLFNDYPKIGVWPDGYYLTMNLFDSNDNWRGPQVYVLDRASMLQGLPATYQTPGPIGTYAGTMLPADVDGPPPPSGSPEYLLDLEGSGLALRRYHVDWSNPANSSLSGPISLSTASWTQLCSSTRDCIAQPGTSQRLDAIGDRLMHRLAYRNFGDHDALVVDHTVNAGSSQAAVRWYEIRNPGTSPTIYQQGTYAPDSDNRWMGSAAMDAAGDLAIGYSVSSAATYPSIRYAGRLASDPLGTLPQTEATMLAGTGNQSDPNNDADRWGDYSALETDVDGCTFWYTNEYNNSGAWNWQTRIGSFRFPTCDIAPSSLAASSDATASVGSALEVTVTIKDAQGYIATGYRGTVHFTSTDPATTLPADYTFTQADSGSHTFDVIPRTTGSQTITATDTTNPAFTATDPITVNAGAATLSVSAAGSTYARYPLSVTVTARNGNGAVTTGYRGIVHFASTDSAAWLPPDYTFTAADNGVHTFSVTLNSSGNQTLTATDTGTSSISGSAGPVSVGIASTFASSSGSDSNACLTAASPCRTIAAAISKASPTGTVTVAPGSYSETLALDRNVTLQGAGAATTIIDGGGSGTVIAVPGSVTGKISGFTIRNGNSGGDGGGIDNFGTLQVTNTTISGNTAGYGGGIFNEGGGSLVLANSTISGNTTPSGDKAGGIYNSGSLTMVNSTISGNSSPSGTGGAIRANSSSNLTIVNSTISGNSATYGGGIAILAGTTNPTLSNTILSGNSAGTGPDCYGSITSQGNNLVQNMSSCTGFGASDLQGVNPQLGSLQSNGSPNWTMAPAAGSPAIDAGNDATCSAAPVNNLDERGVTRPAGAHCDIGAYEVSTVKQSIAQGWNGIDVPLQGSGITSLSGLLNSLNGSGQLGSGATTIAATYGNGRFSLFVPGYSADQTVQPSAGIFVFSTKSGTWTPSGSLYSAPQTVALQRGWSYVAAPFPIGGLTASLITAEASSCNAQEVARFTGGSYQVWIPSSSQNLTIPAGSAMWILCQNPTTWQPS